MPTKKTLTTKAKTKTKTRKTSAPLIKVVTPEIAAKELARKAENEEAIKRVLEENARRERIRDAIKSDLEAQFSAKNLNGTHYQNLIEDYVSLYDIKNKLIDDIAARGVQVEYRNGETQYGTKRNESITELTRVNNQMLKILADLGLKAAEIEVIEDDEL